MLIVYWNEVYMQFIEVIQSQTFRIIVIMFRFSMFDVLCAFLANSVVHLSA